MWYRLLASVIRRGATKSSLEVQEEEVIAQRSSSLGPVRTNPCIVKLSFINCFKGVETIILGGEEGLDLKNNTTTIFTQEGENKSRARPPLNETLIVHSSNSICHGDNACTIAMNNGGSLTVSRLTGGGHAVHNINLKK